MPAVNTDLMLQAMLDQTQGQGQRDRLLVEAGQLEEPDADAQSGFDLPHVVLEREGRPDRDRHSAGARRLDCRQHRHGLADAAGGRRSRRRRQGQGRQVSDPAARLQGRGACGLHRRFSPTRSAASRCCAPIWRATAMPTSRSPSPTASRSRSIRSRRPTSRRRPISPTPTTSCSIPPSPTMRASIAISTAWCRTNRGSIATAP